MKRIFTLVLFLSATFYSFAQEEATLSGYIKDATTGETLIGATIYCPELSTGTNTNAYGFYSMKVPLKEVLFEFSFIGYAPAQKTITISKDTSINLELIPGKSLETVIVSAESGKERVNTTQMGLEKITMKEAKLLPALLGEVDIIKTLQLKPGVKTGGEGTSGIIVRGGSTDQNLFLLDEATIYNPSHLFGFFSTFNSDAVKDVQLYKGGFPAQYGGRLSSVVDVKLNEGNKKKFSGAGGVGLVASRLTLEGPIKKDKSSFVVSGRRTYVDIITRQINKANEDDPEYDPIPDYYFYDFNAKANFELGKKDKLFVSGYLGRDFFKFEGNSFKFNFNWGNASSTIRWNHIFNPKLFANTTATFSDYNYVIKNQLGDLFSFELSSGIRDYTLKSDFFYAPNNQHNIKFGIDYTRHNFEVGRLRAGANDGSFNYEAGQNFTGDAMALYFSEEYEANKKLKLNAGLRLTGFYNDKFYWGIEPRVSMKYSLLESLSVKASYTYMTQYIHLVTNSAASLPTDIWYPSNETVQPQRSNQVALGFTFAPNENYILSNETYYKWNANQVDFRDGAQLFVNDKLDEEFVFGRGWSYGNELYFEKKQGRLKGWVAYTLAWSWRQFDDILDGKRFHPNYDTRHDFTIVGIYELSKRWSLTATWVYTTGTLTSLAPGRFTLQDIPGADLEFVVPDFVERNNYRLIDYHRMDIGAVWKFKHRWGESDLSFSVYNVYDRRNAYFLYIDEISRGEEPNEIPAGFQAKQVSLFPIIPSITYNFKF